MDTIDVDSTLIALGQLLERRNTPAAIVIVGGAALIQLGVIKRATRDVDVIATADPRPVGPPLKIARPTISVALADAVATVARDLGLPSDWLNTLVAGQWETGLPPGFADRLIWRRLSGLWLGIAGRLDLVFLKLFAAADDTGPRSRHVVDLLALRPSERELADGAAWIRTQDPSPAVTDAVAAVIRHVSLVTR